MTASARTTWWLVSLALLTQSIRLPGFPSASLGLPLLLAAVTVVCCSSAGVPLVQLGAVLVVGGAALSLTAMQLENGSSLQSAFFLLVILVVTSFRPALSGVAVWSAVRWVGLAAAGVSLGQLLLQVAGGEFISLHTIAPATVLEGFNSVAPFSFGSSYVRSNGFLFLESSNAAQVMALAALSEIPLGQRLGWRRTTLMLGGIAATGTGGGLVILGAYFLARSIPSPLVLVTARERARREAPVALLSFAVLLAVVVAVGSATGRLSEASSTNSSFYFRFIRPYTWVADTYRDDAPAMFWGLGAGRADDVASADAEVQGTLDATLFPVIPKSIIELGVFVGLATAVLVWRNTVKRWPKGTQVTALLVVFVLNGGPLNPATVIPVWLVGCGVFSVNRREPVSPPIRKRWSSVRTSSPRMHGVDLQTRTRGVM